MAALTQDQKMERSGAIAAGNKTDAAYQADNPTTVERGQGTDKLSSAKTPFDGKVQKTSTRI